MKILSSCSLPMFAWTLRVWITLIRLLEGVLGITFTLHRFGMQCLTSRSFHHSHAQVFRQWPQADVEEEAEFRAEPAYEVSSSADDEVDAVKEDLTTVWHLSINDLYTL